MKKIEAATKSPAAKSKGRRKASAKAPEKKISEKIAENVAKARSGEAEAETHLRPDVLTREAHRWFMDRNSIPGAGGGEGYSPFRFSGWEPVDDIYNALGRPLELHEVQKLVKQDGTAFCDSEKFEFVAVSYVRRVNQSILDKIKATKSLEGIEFEYKGAFYSHSKIDNGAIFAYSGCVLNMHGRYATDTPIFLAAKEYGFQISRVRKQEAAANGHDAAEAAEKADRHERTPLIWGHPHARVEEIQANRVTWRTERRESYRKEVGARKERISNRFSAISGTNRGRPSGPTEMLVHRDGAGKVGNNLMPVEAALSGLTEVKPSTNGNGSRH